MLNLISTIFSSSVVGSIERIASEAIETEKESAEARALFIKVLDPNGLMRRELSRFACVAYGFYLTVTVGLIFAHSFALTDPENSLQAIESLTALFLPITSSWAAIVAASFGVNAANVIKKAP